MKNKKIVIGSVLVLLIVISLISFVSANDYTLICLKKYEKLKFSECHPLMDDKYCNSDSCSYCTYIGSKGKLCPASLNKCNAGGSTCTSLGGNGSDIDRTAPNISSCSGPVNGSVYASKSQYIRANSNKVGNWYYKDMNDRKPKWRKMCSKTSRCNKKVRFDEGKNHIKIKIVSTQTHVSSEEKEVIFYIDSKKPKIYKTYPKKGFASGEFEVIFKEESPKSLVLYYGGKNKSVDLDNNCRKVRTKTYCMVEVDVSEFDGKRIPYWFRLVDRADTAVNSKRIYLEVDIKDPELVNDNTEPGQPDSFWSQGEGRYNKYIYFDMRIIEKNFDDVYYQDLRDRKPKWKKLCSRLKNGRCEKKKSFKKGMHHIVDVQIVDEAGNSISKRIEFDV